MRRLAAMTVLAVLALAAGCGSDGDVNAGGGVDGGFCDRARALDPEMEMLEAQLQGDEVPSADAFDQTANAIGDLAGEAPDEVGDDLQTVADVLHEVADTFGAIDLNDPDALSDPANAEKLAAMGERIGALDESIAEAVERVERYLAEECDIDVRDDGGSDVDDGTDETEGS